MRRTFIYILLLALVTLNNGCKKPGDGDAPELSAWTYTFPKEGGEFVITSEDMITVYHCFYNGTEYYSSDDGYLIEGPWFTVDPDTNEIDISVTKNDTGQERNFSIGIQRLNWFGAVKITQNP